MAPLRSTLRPLVFVTGLTLCAACGADSSDVGGGYAADTDEGGTGASESDTQSSAGGSGTSGDECLEHAWCASSEPVCVDGTCSPCDAAEDPDAACAERDADAPLCNAGRCVACTADQAGACEGDSPVCNEDLRCVPCSAHDQCSVACDLDSGACIDRLMTVDANGEGDFEDLASALATVTEGQSVAIRLVAFDSCYVGSAEVPAEARVALLADGDEMPCLTSLDPEPVLSLSDGAAAFVHRIRIDNAPGLGIEGTAATLWLQRSEVVNNQGGGVSFSQLSKVVIDNSILGGDRNHVAAVDVRDTDLEVNYATLAGGFGDAVALSCTGDSDVAVRNSILVAESSGGEVACSDALIVRSALESAFGTGNVAVGSVDTAAWFVDFARGDLHLQAEAATMFQGVARWSSTDPATDLDGDPRPGSGSEDDAVDWAGADIPAVP